MMIVIKTIISYSIQFVLFVFLLYIEEEETEGQKKKKDSMVTNKRIDILMSQLTNQQSE